MNRNLICLLLLSGLALSGCERREQAPSASTSKPDTTISESGDLKDAADKLADKAKAAVDEATTKAKELLETLRQSIEDNKLDLADDTLTKLDGLKGSLSESLQQQIETARTALKAKKAASGDLGQLKGLTN